MKVEEAREALAEHKRSCPGGFCATCMDLADAYALAVHVEACIKHNWADLPANTELTKSKAEALMRKCGDGWYCDKAPKGGST